MRLFYLMLCYGVFSMGMAYGQDPVTDSIPHYFTYTTRGLEPEVVYFTVGSASAADLYEKVSEGFMGARGLFPDEYYKLTKAEPGESFTLKGRRVYVFCGKNILGQRFCHDGKYTVVFEFNDEGFLMRPLKLRMATANGMWKTIALDEKAFFYKKDRSIRDECLNCPEAIVDIFDRLAIMAHVFSTDIPQEVIH